MEGTVGTETQSGNGTAQGKASERRVMLRGVEPALWGRGAILKLDRAGIAALAAGVAHAMDDGRDDPLRWLALSKKAVELFSSIERAARARCPLGLARGEVMQAHGCAITERETGVRYDYSVCGDAEWESLTAEIAALESRKKEREAFLRNVPAPRLGPEGANASPVFGPDGAELRPPLRTAALGIAVTVK